MEIIGSAPAFETPEIQRPDRACDCGQWNWKLASGIVRAAPAINGAVEALTGCEGKTAVIFATCGAEAKDTLPHLERALHRKGGAGHRRGCARQEWRAGQREGRCTDCGGQICGCVCSLCLPGRFPSRLSRRLLCSLSYCQSDEPFMHESVRST